MLRLGAQFGAMTGMSLGVVATYLGWESIFYTLGTAILAWFVLWVFLVYNDPEEHPRIQEVLCLIELGPTSESESQE